MQNKVRYSKGKRLKKANLSWQTALTDTVISHATENEFIFMQKRWTSFAKKRRRLKLTKLMVSEWTQ